MTNNTIINIDNSLFSLDKIYKSYSINVLYDSNSKLNTFYFKIINKFTNNLSDRNFDKYAKNININEINNYIYDININSSIFNSEFNNILKSNPKLIFDTIENNNFTIFNTYNGIKLIIYFNNYNKKLVFNF